VQVLNYDLGNYLDVQVFFKPKQFLSRSQTPFGKRSNEAKRRSCLPQRSALRICRGNPLWLPLSPYLTGTTDEKNRFFTTTLPHANGERDG